MKKTFYCLLLILFSTSIKGYATHEVGGDFEYDCIDSINRIYKIRLVLYRDCSGIPMQSQVAVNVTFSNGCPTQTYVIPAKPQPPNGNIAVEVTPLCNPKPASTCTVGGSAIKGIQKFVYEQSVQFPPNCGIANLSYESCCRNVGIGPGSLVAISPSGSTQFYLYASINTDLKRGNNSVKFINEPSPYICAAAKFFYNPMGSEIDGDSLVYSLVPPAATNAINCIWNGPFSYTKPFAMLEAQIELNSQTGSISFTPTTPQISIISFMVREYRKIKNSLGLDSVVFVGSIVRDIQWIVTGPCIPIIIDGIIQNSVEKADYYDSLNLSICTIGNDTTKFKFRAHVLGLPLDVPLNMSITMVNNAISFTNKSFVITAKKDSVLLRDTVIGDISFIAPNNKPGYYSFNVLVSYCKNGFKTVASLSFGVYVNLNNPIPILQLISNADSICYSNRVLFAAKVLSPGQNPSLKWYINNALIKSGNSDTMSTLVGFNDSIWVVHSSELSCGAKSWNIKSQIIKPVVVDSLIPSIEIGLPDNPPCLFDTFFIKKLVRNQGQNPQYKIYKNGIVFPTNGVYLLPGQFQKNDTIQMELISNLVCAKLTNVYSNILIINISNISAVPTVSITVSKDTVCKGKGVKFTATNSNGGTKPIYYWYHNGVLLGTTYVNEYVAFPDTSGLLECSMKSSNPCVSNNIANSNKVAINVIIPKDVVISIGPTNPIIYEGQLLPIVATTANVGIQPIYTWMVNNNLWTTSYKDTMIFFGLKDGDEISVYVVPDLICTKDPFYLSNKIRVKVNSIIHVSQVNSDHIKTYPNPVNDFLTIEFDQPITSKIVCQVTDMQGRELNSYIRLQNTNTNKLRLDVSALNSGIYWIKIQMGEKQYQEKFLK